MKRTANISFQKQKHVILKMLKLFKDAKQQMQTPSQNSVLLDVTSQVKNKQLASTITSKVSNQNEFLTHSCLMQRVALSGDLKQISSHVQQYQQKVLRLVHQLSLKNDILLENNQKMKRMHSNKY